MDIYPSIDEGNKVRRQQSRPWHILSSIHFEQELTGDGGKILPSMLKPQAEHILPFRT
jgi:hypothetical protein